eukprot:jgi/Botrbrau1/19990/Bobra.0796s0003.1
MEREREGRSRSLEHERRVPRNKKRTPSGAKFVSHVVLTGGTAAGVLLRQQDRAERHHAHIPCRGSCAVGRGRGSGGVRAPDLAVVLHAHGHLLACAERSATR